MAQRPTVTQMSRKFESHAFTGNLCRIPDLVMRKGRKQRYIVSGETAFEISFFNLKMID